MSELFYSLPPWNLHNLGSLFNQNFNQDARGLIDESQKRIFRSPEMDFGNVSTGYLEDALLEFSVRSKRRRLSLNAEDKPNNTSQNNWGLSENFSCTTSQFAEKNDNDNKKKKKKRVVYPFEVVKPGGREEDVTLNDINKRILMPSARPVRHPVGVFACRSANGPGISGKAVVALTKIQTCGKGTVTIIRTKG